MFAVFLSLFRASGGRFASRRPLSRKSPKTASGSSEFKSDKNTANTQQVRFLKLYFDFNVFSAENRRLFSIEFQLHTNSHITLWLPVLTQAAICLEAFLHKLHIFSLTPGINFPLVSSYRTHALTESLACERNIITEVDQSPLSLPVEGEIE